MKEIFSDGPYRSDLGVKIETMEAYKAYLKKDKVCLGRWISEHKAYYEATDDSDIEGAVDIADEEEDDELGLDF